MRRPALALLALAVAVPCHGSPPSTKKLKKEVADAAGTWLKLRSPERMFGRTARFPSHKGLDAGEFAELVFRVAPTLQPLGAKRLIGSLTSKLNPNEPLWRQRPLAVKAFELVSVSVHAASATAVARVEYFGDWIVDPELVRMVWVKRGRKWHLSMRPPGRYTADSGLFLGPVPGDNLLGEQGAVDATRLGVELQARAEQDSLASAHDYLSKRVLEDVVTVNRVAREQDGRYVAAMWAGYVWLRATVDKQLALSLQANAEYRVVATCRSLALAEGTRLWHEFAANDGETPFPWLIVDVTVDSARAVD